MKVDSVLPILDLIHGPVQISTPIFECAPWDETPGVLEIGWVLDRMTYQTIGPYGPDGAALPFPDNAGVGFLPQSGAGLEGLWIMTLRDQIRHVLPALSVEPENVRVLATRNFVVMDYAHQGSRLRPTPGMIAFSGFDHLPAEADILPIFLRGNGPASLSRHAALDFQMRHKDEIDLLLSLALAGETFAPIQVMTGN